MASTPPRACKTPVGITIDSHLVMNVLNQIAAQYFKEHGVENSLLFALSDYLQDALRHLGKPTLSLSNEVKLLESHVQLMATVNRAETRLYVDLKPNSTLPLAHGTLARITSCLLKASRPQFGGIWRIQLAVGDDASSLHDIAATIEIRGASAAHVLELATAQERLAKLCHDKENPVQIRSAEWSQDQPQHLRLVCSICSSQPTDPGPGNLTVHK